MKLDVSSVTNIAVSKQVWTGWPDNVNDDLSLAQLGIPSEHNLYVNRKENVSVVSNSLMGRIESISLNIGHSATPDLNLVYSLQMPIVIDDDDETAPHPAAAAAASTSSGSSARPPARRTNSSSGSGRSAKLKVHFLLLRSSFVRHQDDAQIQFSCQRNLPTFEFPTLFAARQTNFLATCQNDKLTS